MVSMESSKAKTTADQKKDTKVHLTFAKTNLDDAQDFSENILGQMRQKINFLEGVLPLASDVKLTQHSRKGASY